MSNKTHDLLSEIIIKTWTDDSFKESFMDDPISTFKNYGIEVNESVGKINIVENTKNEIYFVVPQKPDLATLSSSDLRSLASKLLEEQLVLPTIL